MGHSPASRDLVLTSHSNGHHERCEKRFQHIPVSPPPFVTAHCHPGIYTLSFSVTPVILRFIAVMATLPSTIWLTIYVSFRTSFNECYDTPASSPHKYRIIRAWDVISSVHSDYGLLGCDAVSYYRWLPRFRKNTLLPPSLSRCSDGPVTKISYFYGPRGETFTPVFMGKKRTLWATYSLIFMFTITNHRQEHLTLRELVEKILCRKALTRVQRVNVGSHRNAETSMPG
jgi:hypothetical protein